MTSSSINLIVVKWLAPREERRRHSMHLGGFISCLWREGDMFGDCFLEKAGEEPLIDM